MVNKGVYISIPCYTNKPHQCNKLSNRLYQYTDSKTYHIISYHWPSTAEPSQSWNKQA